MKSQHRSLHFILPKKYSRQWIELNLPLELLRKNGHDSRVPLRLSPTRGHSSTHKNLMADGIAQMKSYLANPTDEGHQAIWKLLKQIDNLQGDDYRKIHWTTVHFVRSGYLIKLEYALHCFMAQDFQYWAYKLAREYVECYQPGYGDGLTPNSAPMLLEVADFWCQYYFDCPLDEKFPQDMLEIVKKKS